VAASRGATGRTADQLLENLRKNSNTHRQPAAA
jgi:hypothetical protein